MDNLAFQIKNFAFETGNLIADFFKDANPYITGGSALLFYIIFMRGWTLKKCFSFAFAIFIFFVGLVHTEAFLITKLGVENASIPTGIARVLFLALAITAYFYQAALKE